MSLSTEKLTPFQPRLSKARAYFNTLAGWQHALAAAGLGAASVLAMAPVFLWPVLLLSLPCLIWMVDGQIASVSGKPLPGRNFFFRRLFRHPVARAAGTAWCFGFGYHLFGLFWIGEAFLVEAEKFAVLMPFAVTLLPAGLALFWGAAAAVAALAWRPGFERVVAFAIALAAAEWLRGHVLTGFPWNVIGYALTYPLLLMQAASVFGIYGLTLLALIIFAAPGVLLAAREDQPDLRHGLRSWLPALIVAVPLSAMALFGAYRLGNAETNSAGLKVRIVQPSIPQREKWLPDNQEQIFRQHLDISLQNVRGENDGARGISLIIWPEAAMPFLPLQSPGALAAIGRTLPAEAYLATGALRLGERADGRQIFNSLMVFDSRGTLVANYDKLHLVPFGEYLPLQNVLEAIGLEQLSRLRGGFASGVRPRPLLSIPGLPIFGPLVCYEAIFPAAIVQGADRPAVLLNVTNDGWFGNTTGPRQHFHQTRVRAVEEGVPILRAANNGISAVIDPRGRILAEIGMNQIGSIDATIPIALPPPPYARHGDWIFAWLMLAALIGLAACRFLGPAETRDVS